MSIPEKKNRLFQQRLQRKTPKTTHIGTPPHHIIVDGLTKQPLTLTYDTMTEQFSRTRLHGWLMCSGHTPENSLANSVIWEGIRIHDILTYTEPTPAAQVINFYSSDGYATSLPLSALNEALIAIGMNGEPLPDEHGYPARLIVPGRYGYKQPKWLQHIIVAAEPITGYWEQRGWDHEGIAPATATVDESRVRVRYGDSITLRGSTNRDDVSISIEEGAWNPVQRVYNMRWEAHWTPPAPGYYKLRIQAVGQPEATQPEIIVEVTV